MNSKISFKLVKDNLDWVEHTFMKIGNQLKISGKGYKKECNH